MTFGLDDEFGFRPRFTLSHTGQQFRRLIDAVKNAPSLTLDCAALNTFLRAGMFLNGKTPFREIARYHPSPVIVPPETLSRDAAIDAYIDLFRQAVRRRIAGRSVLALSGGCDSRHILLELHAQGRLPDRALTVAIPGRPTEVHIAEALARRTGVRHIVRAPDPSRAVEDELWKNRACDFMSFDHGWFAFMGRSRDATPWWDGIAGDVLSAGHFLHGGNLRLFEENRLDQLAGSIACEQAEPWFWDKSLRHKDDALAEVRAELELHRNAPNPVGSFYFWNRTRVVIGSCAFGLLSPNGEEVLAPYLDRDLWRFLASLPARMMLDHKFHSDTVSRAYPEFAGIPYFREKEPIDRRTQRTKALRLLPYLCRAFRPGLQDPAMLARVLRALIQPGRLNDIGWMLPRFVYTTQLRRLA